MKVYKFGGTSVGLPERMQSIARLITEDSEPKIVVLSALSGTTNSLVNIGEALNSRKQDVAHLLINDIEKHYLNFIQALYSADESRQKAIATINRIFSEIRALGHIPDFNAGNNKSLLAYGEILSTHLFHYYLNEIQIKNELLNSLDFMRINSEGEPDLQYVSEQLAHSINVDTRLYIAQGFICRNAYGQTDNLKRGGSDYTASLIGAALKVDEIQIWTDIDGMHNNDPRIVKGTQPIEELTFDEAAELAYFGAKILHPATILPAQKYGIPVRLKSTIDPNASGTLIGINSDKADVKAIAAKDDITAIKIKSSRMLLAYGFLKNIFEIFGQYKTSIDMITTSEVAVSLTIDNTQNIDEIVGALEKFGTVTIDKNQSIICIVGNMLSEKKGLLNKIFKNLDEIPIRMVSYGGSRSNISLLVDTKYKNETLTQLNRLFTS
ncbi:MAG TPA: aspartate kinase [Fulvivirga sp.]|nr:aspartate kinase [Fulvivirga sp.]